MAATLTFIWLERCAVVAFRWGITKDNARNKAARLWDGIDEWIAQQPQPYRNSCTQLAAKQPEDAQLSLLIERSQVRHSYAPPSFQEAQDALLAAVLMQIIVNDGELISSIPANLQIDPDTGYIMYRTVPHTQIA